MTHGTWCSDISEFGEDHGGDLLVEVDSSPTGFVWFTSSEYEGTPHLSLRHPAILRQVARHLIYIATEAEREQER